MPITTWRIPLRFTKYRCYDRPLGSESPSWWAFLTSHSDHLSALTRWGRIKSLITRTTTFEVVSIISRDWEKMDGGSEFVIHKTVGNFWFIDGNEVPESDFKAVLMPAHIDWMESKGKKSFFTEAA